MKMHVPGFAADVSFISLNMAGGFSGKRFIVQREANPMQHEPGGFLGHAKAASDLIRGHAILGIHNHPNSAEPLIQLDRTILKDGSDLHAVLFLAALTFPE
jgi:hypothetical protein